jgi:protein-tyrosine phosphatase
MINGFLTENYHTLADSNYILTEYSHHDEFAYVKKMTEDTLFFGFIPVIAHVERYEFAGENPENVAQLRDLGAMIQINADAVLGLDGHPAKKLCRVLLRKGLVDMIASDSHGISERACHMRQCYEFVEKKYGAETAEKLFITNPAQVLEQSTEFSQDVRFFREKRGGEQQTVHVLRESAHA